MVLVVESSVGVLAVMTVEWIVGIGVVVETRKS